MFEANPTATLEALAFVKAKAIDWGRGWGRPSRCRALDELSLELILNSTEDQLRRVRDVGPRRVKYLRECLAKLFPEDMLALFPFFNAAATPIPTAAQKEREAEEAAKKTRLARWRALYDSDDE